MSIRDLSPKPKVAQTMQSEDSEEDTYSSSSPVFQFSPEFHRVPSPIFIPEHTFIPGKFDEVEASKPKTPILSVGVGTVHTTTHPAENPIILNPVPLEKPKELSPIEQFPPTRFNTVSARAKFFEMEIQQQQQPIPKPGE